MTRREMSLLNTVTVLQFLMVKVCGVHISRVGAPSVVLGGEELVIDCDFDYLEEEQDQLDLKWYFNSSPFPIYQWVPSMHRGPQVIGEMFRSKLDLLYSAHNDTFKKHRALHILNPDHRFSGTYMCKVSSFVDEDFQQKDILVIAQPQRIQLSPMVSLTDRNLLNVTCKVEAIFPSPDISLSWTVNSSTMLLTDTERRVREGHTGLLDVMVSSLVEHQGIETEGVIGCQVTIPHTEWSAREELQLFHYQNLKSWYTSQGLPSVSPQSPVMLTLILCLPLLLSPQ